MNNKTTNFEQMVNTWTFVFTEIVPSDKIKALKEDLENFLANWETHGKSVDSYYEFSYEQVLQVFAQPESDVSGCAKDSLRLALSELFQKFDLNYFPDDYIFWFKDEKLVATQFQEAKQKIKSGEITAETHFLNTTSNWFDTFEELKANRIVMVKDSWFSRYLEFADH